MTKEKPNDVGSFCEQSEQKRVPLTFPEENARSGEVANDKASELPNTVWARKVQRARIVNKVKEKSKAYLYFASNRATR